jgi:hypothetical protein
MAQQNREDRGSLYDKLLVWGPVIAGFLLPYTIYTLFNPSFLLDLAKTPDEFVIMSIGAIISDIPFFVVAFFANSDKNRKYTLRKRINNTAIRFLPVFGIYAFLLYDVARAAALRLPGASTAPIAILIFLPIAVLLVFVLQWITKAIER